MNVANGDCRTPTCSSSIDRTKPIYLEMSGTWNKKSGYARLAPGAAAPERLVWLDKGVARLARDGFRN